MLARRASLVSVTLLAATFGGSCGARVSAPELAGGVDGGGADVAQRSSDVTGRAVTHYRMDSGVIADVAFDLSHAKIVAYVEKADAGYDAVDGAGYRDGTFVVRDVPLRPYVLRVGATLFVHPARDVTLNRLVDGRPDAAALPDSVHAALHVTNLAPWTTSSTTPSYVQIIAANAGTEWALDSAPLRLVAGATSIDASDALLRGWPSAVIDPARGDRAVMFQQNPLVAPDGTPYSAVVRTLDLVAFAAQTSTASPIVGAFVDVTMNETLRYEWDTNAFTSHFSALPDGALDARVAAAEARPHTGGVGGENALDDLDTRVQTTFSATLAGTFEEPPFTDGSHVLPYGQPFAGWHENTVWWIDYRAERIVPHTEAGAALTAARIFLLGELPSSGAIAPKLSHVEDAKIDGAPLLTTVALTSDTPTLTWSTPRLATPQNASVLYFVSACTLDQSLAVPCVNATTADTRFEFPPGMLERRAYLVEIGVASTSDASMFASRPYDVVYGADYATVSAPFVVR